MKDSVRNDEAPRAAAVRIGEWVADPATNELRRGADTVRLEPRSMDLLMALAHRAGTVVSRDELFAAVWPGVVVGDEALSQGITKLRRALGDEAKTPRYIETIAKRGYRLVAPVQPIGGTVPVPPGNRGRRSRKPMAVALAIVAVFVLAAIITAPWPQGSAPPPAPRAAQDPEIQWITVTVMPFESIGADDYLARGMTDTLMTELGRLSALRLIGPGGASQYAVSGSVQRDATKVRVNVRLVDARSGEQLWSERIERPAGELFEVQDDLVRHLAAALPAKVSESERQRLARRHTRSLEAYDHFLRAQALFLARSAADNDEARELYRKAIELDPKFARAYAGLAMTHAIEHRLRPGEDPARGLERALALAETARQIDPDIAEVYWALGFVHAQVRRHDQALDELQKAIDLNPSFADAYALMAGVYTYVGQSGRSIPLMRTALRLKPQGGYLYYVVLGRAYVFENDAEQAIINLREASVRNPADIETRVLMAAAHVAAGNLAAAQWEAEEVRSLERGFSAQRWLDGYPLASPPYRERLQQMLAKAGL